MSICRNDWIIEFCMSQVISRCPIAMCSPAAMCKHFAGNGRRKRKCSMSAAVHRFSLQQSHMQMSCGLPESSSRIQGIPGFRRFALGISDCFQMNKKKDAASCIIVEDKQEGRELYAFCRSNRKKETEAATDKGRASFFHYRLCPGEIFRIIRSVRC